MNKEQQKQQDIIDAILGKKRAIHAREETLSEKLARTLSEASRRVNARMTESEHKASILRGCP